MITKTVRSTRVTRAYTCAMRDVRTLFFAARVGWKVARKHWPIARALLDPRPIPVASLAKLMPKLGRANDVAGLEIEVELSRKTPAQCREILDERMRRYGAVKDVDREVRNLGDGWSSWFRVKTSVDVSREVKVEWFGHPQSGAHVLLSTENARELASKMRRAVGLSKGSGFRESVFGIHEDELCVLVTPSGRGVFLCLGFGDERFEELGKFPPSAAERFAVALEDAASAIDRELATFRPAT